MKIFARVLGFSGPRLGHQILACVLSLTLLFGTWPGEMFARQNAQTQAPQYAPQTPEQLQQLVAPIALYPDSLVAQILAASTFPEQVVQADRWLQAHPDLKGEALARAVDQEPWDPSVKALTAFPSVLGNMDRNLSWTSSLGDAYYNQQEDVMDAIQVMRQRAEAAGNLKSTPQQTVTTQDSTVIIEPASPEIVYIPAYNPWLIYGEPLFPWPGWYEYPGIWFGGPYLSFGVGFGIGFFAGYGWGWPYWGFNWHNHFLLYNHNRYYSRSVTFYNRNYFYRGRVMRGVGARPGVAPRPSRPPRGYAAPVPRSRVYNRPGATPRPFGGSTRAARGYAAPRGQSGVHSGAFSGYDHGGQARSFSSRGRASVSGGAARGGGGRHR
jgi:hypothetical protein